MLKSYSLVFLIAANLIPIAGVLFFGWEAGFVIGLFWIENLIIGVFNIIKMLAVSWQRRTKKGLFETAFFLVHYGLFCTIHGIFLWDLLNLGSLNPQAVFEYQAEGIFQFFQEGGAVLVSLIHHYQPNIYWAIAALCLSHLVSFIEQFLIKGEIFVIKESTLMIAPYAQIFIMHAGIILGAIALKALGSPVWLLLIITLFKVIVDIKMFHKRHSLVDQRSI